MNFKDWKVQYDETIKILDSLNLPLPRQSEDLYDYKERVEEEFNYITLPPQFEGELFNFMSAQEFGDYLHKRYGWIIHENISYSIWRN